MKRELDIEKLLHWAFDELSKRYTSSAEGIWNQIEEYGQRGGIDVGHGAAQRYAHFGLPHPDAEKIEQAVIALPDTAIDWNAEAELVLGDLIALADPRTKPKPTGKPARKPNVIGWYEGSHFVSLAVQPPRDLILVRSLRTSALIGMHAKLATRPDWQSDAPLPNCVIGSKGKPVLIGECWGKRAYSPGSHCPIEWEPSPISIAESRADYLAWWRGLTQLVQSLELDEHTALPPAAPERPWLDERKPAASLHMTEHKFTRALPLAPQRDRAGAPLRRRAVKASASF